MAQSRLESMVETLVNTAIGYSVAVTSQIIIFPFFDIHLPVSSNLLIASWFTVISIARGYVIRRFFETRLHQFSHAIAGQVDRLKSLFA